LQKERKKEKGTFISYKRRRRRRRRRSRRR
jgi:hypothetical protein